MKNYCFLLFILIAGSVQAATYTATTSGNWSDGATWGGTAPGNNIILDNIIIPSGITVTLNNDVTFNGLLASLEVNGTLMSSMGNDLNFNQGQLEGTGTITLYDLYFGTLSTMDYTGHMTINNLENESLGFDLTNDLTIKDTLWLTDGSINLQTGSELIFSANSLVIVEDGFLDVTGGAVTGTSMYNVKYMGASKTTGEELSGSGLNEVWVALNSNTAVLTLDDDITMDGVLHHDMGIIALAGNKLTLNNNYVASGGTSITGSTTSDLTINYANNVSSPLIFTTGAGTLHNLEITLTGNADISIASNLTITNRLILHGGRLGSTNTSAINMAPNSGVEMRGGSIYTTLGAFTSAGSYDVWYIGSSMQAGKEATASGLNDVTVTLNAASDSVTLNNAIVVNGTLTLDKGMFNLNTHNLTINGDYMSNGGMLAGNSSSNLTIATATAPSDSLMFAANKNMLRTLNINTTNGDFVVVGSALTLQALSFTKGGLTIWNNDLTITTGGAIANFDNNKFVRIMGSGKLTMDIDTGTFKAFPVGKNTYSPAHIKLNGGTTRNMSVGLMYGIWTDGTSGNNRAMTQRVVNRTWDITSTNTTGFNMDLRLEWTAAAEVNGFNRSKCYITHYTASDWDTDAIGDASVTANTYYRTRTGITSLSPFGVADASATLNDTTSDPGPGVFVKEIESANLRAYPNPVSSTLTFEAEMGANTTINLVDITGRLITTKNIENASNRQSIDVSNLPSGVYFLKVYTDGKQLTKKIVKS